MSGSVDATKTAWVERVLGLAVRSGLAQGEPNEASLPGELTRSAERAREAAASNIRGIAYPKLLLRWRDAQSLVAGNLASVGKSILARPDVQTDPRFKDVEKIVAVLPKLVPKFGGQLENVLDAGLNEGNGPNASRLAAQAIVAIDEYRQRLGAAAPLLKLEKFLTKEMGQAVVLHQALDEALVELKQEMSTRV